MLLHFSLPVKRAGEGGGRLLIGFAILVFFVSGATFNSLGLLSEAIATDTGRPTAAMLSTASAFLLGFYIAGPLAAVMLSRIGKHWVITGGATVAALGYGWLAHAQGAADTAAALAAAGAGVGGATVVPAITLLGRHYRRDIGFAVGSVIAAGAAGASLLPPVIGTAITALGWRVATDALAWMIVIVTACVVTVIAPVDDNVLEADAPAPASDHGPSLMLAGARFWCVTVATSLAQLGVMGAYVGFIPFLVARGYTLADSGSYFGAMNLFSAIGCLLIGIAADQYGPRRTTILALIANTACIMLLLLTSVPGVVGSVVIAFVILWGLVQGAPYQLGPVLLAEMMPADILGHLSGTLMLVVGVVSSFGPMLFGMIGGGSGDLVAMLVCGALMILPLPLLLVCPPDRRSRDSHTVSMEG